MIRQFDRRQDVAAVCPILSEFWKHVQGDDLMEEVELNVLSVPVRLTKVEAKLYVYLNENCRIMLAEDGDKVVGILIYQELFPGIIGVRALYVDPQYRDMGLVPRLMNAVGGVKRVFFQTLKHREPERVLSGSLHRRKFSETDGAITWEMEWQPWQQ